MNAEELELMYAEFLPWIDPEVEGFVAELSSIREVGFAYNICVNFLLDGAIIGYVKYKYYHGEDHLTATDFVIGELSGEGILRRYADDSLEIFLEYIYNCSTVATDPRIIYVYEQAGWKQSNDDPTLWIIHPGEFIRTT